MTWFISSHRYVFVSMAALVMIAALAACSAPDARTETAVATSKPAATRAAPTPAQTPAPTPTPVPSPSGPPTVTPFVARTSSPTFGDVIFFTDDPNAGTHQRVFPFGVKEVFAVWEYRNMRDGLMVKREWLRSGEVWLTRDELWDFAKYGADGAIRDVSIFDRDEGLPPGQYELRLSIDGVPVVSMQQDVTFTIEKPRPVSENPSPGGGAQVAVLRPPGMLLIRQCAGCTEEALVTAPTIASMGWFPDGGHILYILQDSILRINAIQSYDTRTEMWVVDVASGQHHRIANGPRLRTPVISPDGRTVAVMDGSGRCDAGECDLSMHFLKLDAGLELVEDLGPQAFDLQGTGQDGAGAYPVEDLSEPGQWQSPTVFKAVIWRVMGPDISGIFLLDFKTLTGKKVADIPPRQ